MGDRPTQDADTATEHVMGRVPALREDQREPHQLVSGFGGPSHGRRTADRRQGQQQGALSQNPHRPVGSKRAASKPVVSNFWATQTWKHVLADHQHAPPNRGRGGAQVLTALLPQSSLRPE